MKVEEEIKCTFYIFLAEIIIITRANNEKYFDS